MTCLLDLPNEMLCAIGSEVPIKTLKDLRLCNSRLREALSPVVFSSVAIGDTPTTPRVLSYARYVKCLSIGSWACGKNSDFSALVHLQNVRVVRWQLFGHELEEMVVRIFEYLSSLHSLSELYLISYQPSSFPVPFGRYPIINLSVLSVQGPFSAELSGIPPQLFHLITNNHSLTSLSLDVAWTSSTQHFSHLAENLPPHFFSSLRHLRLPRWHVDISPALIKMMPSLTSLDVTPPSSLSTDHSTLWTALREEKIQLKALSVTVVTQELFDYLTSYSGLHSLVLTDIVSDHVGSEQLYTQVIAKHAESLVSLTVDGRNNDEWCLEARHASVLRSCVKLKDLSVVIKAEDLDDIESLVSSVPSSLRTLCLSWNSSYPDAEYLRSFMFRLYDQELETHPINQSLIIYADIVYLLGRADEGKPGFVFRGFKIHRSQPEWTPAIRLCGSMKMTGGCSL